MRRRRSARVTRDLFETADGKKLSLVGLSYEQMLEVFEQGSISEAYQALEIKV